MFPPGVEVPVLSTSITNKPPAVMFVVTNPVTEVEVEPAAKIN
jgi:hypothetical protein